MARGRRGSKRKQRDFTSRGENRFKKLRDSGEARNSDHKQMKLGNTIKERKPQKTEPDLSSASSDETENTVNQLLSTFNCQIPNDSDSEESSEDSDSEISETSDISENFVDRLTKETTTSDSKPYEDEEHSTEELEDENDDVKSQANDPFEQHFGVVIEDKLVESLKLIDTQKTSHFEWPEFGRFTFYHTKNIKPNHYKEEKLCTDVLKPQLVKNLKKSICGSGETGDTVFTPLQTELFSIFSDYFDLYYTSRNYKNGEEIRYVYCLHALNHVLKTRSRIIHHNAKIMPNSEISESYRDQGLTRAKVLILVPFREAAIRIVNLMIKFLFEDEKSNVINKKRFQSEYGSQEKRFPKIHKKPEDYEATFTGNTDDMFRIGISITKKSLKLYADFYTADIIIASPLGLRTVIGSEGDTERDFDFLSSIEMLVLDQTDIFLMQNWDHILQIFSHLHLQPQEAHGVDFSRVRMWTLNGWSKYYRQTLIFSSSVHPIINAVYNKYCQNYEGKILLRNQVVKGSISQIAVQLPQVFHRLPTCTANNLPDVRFEFFIEKILPQYKDAVMSRTLIFIPSYFDFVRLRNYFKKESISFVQISEYSSDNKVARARDYFFHKKRQFLLYTERAHFFKRYHIKGIRHLIFYEMPLYSHFYSEISNMLQGKKIDSVDNSYSSTVIYAVQDAMLLSEIVGSERAAYMLNSEKNVHMFVTGESSKDQ